MLAFMVCAYPLPDSLVGLGFVVAFPVTLLVVSLIQGPSKWSEWLVVRRSLNSSTLTDGKRVAVFGRIYPVSKEPLRSPFGNNECVAYVYEITRRNQTRGRLGMIQIEGIGLTPSAVETKHGTIKLLAWPDFTSHIAGFRISDVIDNARAAEYVLTASFVQMKPKRWRLGGGESLTSEDGSVRLDAIVTGDAARYVPDYLLRQSKALASFGGAIARESYIPPSAEVCLIGIYSDEKRAIVSKHGRSKRRAKLYEGDPKTIGQYFKPFFYAIAVLAGIVALIISLIAIFAK